MKYSFETVDVFTERQFGGNPLAVFTNAEGLNDHQMQSLAAELNLSETTFILPPENPANTARIRIFNRTAEMSFAGHPCIGTAYVMAIANPNISNVIRFEVPAGIVPVELQWNGSTIVGGKLTAPQTLSIGHAYDAKEIAACLGLSIKDVLVEPHPPVEVSVGNSYVVARLVPEALARCVPDLRAFRDFRDRHPELKDRFSLHVYSGDNQELRARMFAPLAGTIEDPATGSANAPLGALLLSLGTADHAEFNVRQGEEMGRPSRLVVNASRKGEVITATVAGHCVSMLSGTAHIQPRGEA